MKDLQSLVEAGKDNGFTHVVLLSVSTLEVMPEVRQMCESNTCGLYNACWSCPPACGSIADCRDEIKKYKEGLLVQTVGEIEDSLDYESMMRLEKEHKNHFFSFYDELKKAYPKCLALGTGGCTRCRHCTYPQTPCRFPEKMVSSMEAYGLLVSRICQLNQIPYYYGKESIAYTACYLIE